MGQKVNPIGMRIGINKDWSSKWFAENKDFAKYLKIDNDIRKYLEKRLKDAAVSSIDINRNNKKTEVVIYTAKPGVVIGHGGEEIEKIKNEINKLTTGCVVIPNSVDISIFDKKKYKRFYRRY